MAELLSSEQLEQYLRLVARLRTFKSGSSASEPAASVSPDVSLASSTSAGASLSAPPLLMPVGAYFSQAAWKGASVSEPPALQAPVSQAAVLSLSENEASTPEATLPQKVLSPASTPVEAPRRGQVVGTVGDFFARVSWRKASGSEAAKAQGNPAVVSSPALAVDLATPALVGSVQAFFSTTRWEPGALAVADPPELKSDSERDADPEDFFADIHWD